MHRLNHKLTQCGRLVKYKMYDVPRSPLSSCSRSWEGEIMGTSSSFLRNNVEEIGKSSVFNKIMKKNTAINSIADNKLISKDILRIHDAPLLFERRFSSSIQAYSLNKCHAWRFIPPVRSFASDTSQKMSEKEKRKDVSTIEDPFDAPTYNIPEKPVTFTEGASYSIVILAGLGVAAAAAYAVFKELIFEPKEYKIFGKALERVQNDSQVRVRIGTPVTGYGQESRNRAARQRIPSRMWTDEDGVERVEVNFYIRGPHGGGKVYTEMFRDKLDKTWKFTYLIVDIKSPSPTQLMLESYVPA